MDSSSPEFKASMQAIDAVVRQHVDALQPTLEDDVDVPVGAMLLDRFMLICTFLDDDGDEWIVQACEPKVSESSKKGTLFRLLHD